MTAIYHITHLNNLALILGCGELLSDTLIQQVAVKPTNIAHGQIKERRQRTVVTIPPGGVVTDYVPFYFCPRSPMLYAVHGGFVAGYPGGQGQVLHLVADAETIAAQNAICITPTATLPCNRCGSIPELPDSPVSIGP